MGRKRKENDFIITNFGVDDAVTGTSVMVEVDGLKILFDCGQYQDSTKTAQESFKINIKSKNKIPFNEIDAVIINHLHCDHCGFVPALLREDVGFKGNIYTTDMSAPFISMVCCDSAFIQSEQCKAYNKKNPKKDELFPIFTMSEAEQVINHLRCYNYDTKIWLSDRVYFEFKNNGHIIGSASTYLTFIKNEYEEKHLLFTSDFNYNPKIDRPFTKSWNYDEELVPDIIISESTYGDRLHRWNDPEKELEKHIINEVLNKNNVLLIPAFSISRSTQLASMVKHIYDRHEELYKKQIPVYLVGRMTVMAHDIIGRESTKQYVDEQWHDDWDVFKWKTLQKINKFADVEDKLTNPIPKIIIVSGGMGSASSLYLLQEMIDKKWLSVLPSGYSGIGTPVRSIIEAKQYNRDSVSLQGKRKRLIATILDPLEMSGHSDYKQICQMVMKNKKKLKHIILIHGDNNAKENLKEEIELRIKDIDIKIPKNNEKIKL